MKRLLMIKLALLLLVGTAPGQTMAAKVHEFAKAVAKAEGFTTKGTIPARCHNPGDLKIMVSGEKFPGQIGVCKGGHIHFKNDKVGWAALDHQIEKVVAGQSRFYNTHMTIAQVAYVYAGNWRVWAKNVSDNLGTDQSTTLDEVLGLPVPAPAVKFPKVSRRAARTALAFLEVR
jgi:hypothetical protein